MQHWTCLEAMTGCVITSVVMVGEHVNNDISIDYNSFRFPREAVLKARIYNKHCQCMRDRVSYSIIRAEMVISVKNMII